MGMSACLIGGHLGQMKRSDERSGYISYCAIKLIVKVDKQVMKPFFMREPCGTFGLFYPCKTRS